jgi:hypothetical protein
MTEKPNKDRKQVPLRVFEPPPEEGDRDGE